MPAVLELHQLPRAENVELVLVHAVADPVGVFGAFLSGKNWGIFPS